MWCPNVFVHISGTGIANLTWMRMRVIPVWAEKPVDRTGQARARAWSDAAILWLLPPAVLPSSLWKSRHYWSPAPKGLKLENSWLGSQTIFTLVAVYTQPRPPVYILAFHAGTPEIQAESCVRGGQANAQKEAGPCWKCGGDSPDSHACVC